MDEDLKLREFDLKRLRFKFECVQCAIVSYPEHKRKYEKQLDEIIQQIDEIDEIFVEDQQKNPLVAIAKQTGKFEPKFGKKNKKPDKKGN